jgi:hypothetical protein
LIASVGFGLKCTQKGDGRRINFNQINKQARKKSVPMRNAFLKFIANSVNLLFCVGRLGRGCHAKRCTADASESLFCAIIQVPITNSCWFVRFGANHHDFARANGGFFVKTSTLRVLLAGLDVLVSQIYAFDNQHLVLVVN